MLIILINMERSRKRLQFMNTQLQDLGLTYHRLPAIDGARLSPATLTAFASRKPERRWVPGEVGCFLSHLEAWRFCLDQPMRWSLILEDDVHLSKQLPAFLKLFENVPSSPSIIKIETRHAPISVAKKEALAVGSFAFHRCASFSAGSAGYILSREAAERLLLVEADIHDAIDTIFDPKVSARAGVCALQCSPALVVQDEVAQTGFKTILSDIQPERRRKAKLPLRSRIAREIGRILRRRRSLSMDVTRRAVDFLP